MRIVPPRLFCNLDHTPLGLELFCDKCNFYKMVAAVGNLAEQSNKMPPKRIRSISARRDLLLGCTSIYVIGEINGRANQYNLRIQLQRINHCNWCSMWFAAIKEGYKSQPKGCLRVRESTTKQVVQVNKQLPKEKARLQCLLMDAISGWAVDWMVSMSKWGEA